METFQNTRRLAILMIIISWLGFQAIAQPARLKVKTEGVLMNNTGALTSDVSAVLDVNSSDKGVLLPRLSTTQRNAVTNPEEGLDCIHLTGQ